MRFRLLKVAAVLALAGCGSKDADVGNAEKGGAGNAAAPAANADDVEIHRTAREYAIVLVANKHFIDNATHLARITTSRPELRQFAVNLFHDHGRPMIELTIAGKRAKPPIELGPVLMSRDQYAMLEELKRAPGAGFDSLWIRQQIAEHQRILKVAADYAERGELEPMRRQAAGFADMTRRNLSRLREMEAQAPRAN